METKRAMIVDDASLTRMLVGRLLNSDPRISVVASVADGQRALDELQRVQPDLIILDMEMPEMDGVEFLRRAVLLSAAQIIVFSSSASKAQMAMRCGASRVVMKAAGDEKPLAQGDGTLLDVALEVLGLSTSAGDSRRCGKPSRGGSGGSMRAYGAA